MCLVVGAKKYFFGALYKNSDVSTCWWVQWSYTKKKGLSRKASLSGTASAAALALVPPKKQIVIVVVVSSRTDQCGDVVDAVVVGARRS